MEDFSNSSFWEATDYLMKFLLYHYLNYELLKKHITSENSLQLKPYLTVCVAFVAKKPKLNNKQWYPCTMGEWHSNVKAVTSKAYGILAYLII